MSVNFETELLDRSANYRNGLFVVAINKDVPRWRVVIRNSPSCSEPTK